MDEKFKKRFWGKVSKTESCWLWTGCRSGSGYGSIKRTGSSKNAAAHRASYELHKGPIPEGMHVCHRCDNPACVNPDHLFIGTNKDNIDDKMRKGRHKAGRTPGELNHHAKLTESDVAVIRARIAAGEANIAIANDFPVSHSMVSNIRTGKAWRK